jgi:hypothetical protein
MKKLMVIAEMLALVVLAEMSAGAAKSFAPPEKWPGGVKPFWLNGGMYVVQRATGAITVDGKLNEPDWKKPGKVPFMMAATKQPATSAAKGMLLYDDEYLYWACDMRDQDIYGRSYGHDPEWGSDDVTELFIYPACHQKGYWPYGNWEFHITPTGGYRDYYYPRLTCRADPVLMELGESGWETSLTIDGTLNHWTDIDKGWVTEAKIPLTAFSTLARKPQPGDKWHFLMARYDWSAYLPKGPETQSGAYLSEVNFHLLEEYPIMVFGK